VSSLVQNVCKLCDICNAYIVVLAAEAQGILCRLVEGISLNKPLSDLCLPGTVNAPSMEQHEQQVLEIAAQLLQVYTGANNPSL